MDFESEIQSRIGHVITTKSRVEKLGLYAIVETHTIRQRIATNRFQNVDEQLQLCSDLLRFLDTIRNRIYRVDTPIVSTRVSYYKWVDCDGCDGFGVSACLPILVPAIGAGSHGVFQMKGRMVGDGMHRILWNVFYGEGKRGAGMFQTLSTLPDPNLRFILENSKRSRTLPSLHLEHFMGPFSYVSPILGTKISRPAESANAKSITYKIVW